MSKAIKSLKHYNLKQSAARAANLFRVGRQTEQILQNLIIVAGQNFNFMRFYNTKKYRKAITKKTKPGKKQLIQTKKTWET